MSRSLRCLAALLLCLPAWASAAPITVDVGHNTQEPGATGARGRVEFEFNRDLAREIGEALKKRGHAPIVSGDDGNAAQPAGRRVKGVNTALLLSVHHDSVQEFLLTDWEFEGRKLRYSDRFSGFSLFVSRDNPRVQESLKCASAIGAALRGAGFTPSLYHADRQYGENRPFADKDNGVHYFDNLAIVRRAQVPAVLFEAGVIVNRDEELRMRDPAVRAKIANAVADGVTACLKP
ncbi:MAG: N-acetylmuramoyl-L-alanine amidase [Burkholderiales bacterium]